MYYNVLHIDSYEHKKKKYKKKGNEIKLIYIAHTITYW